MSTTYTARFAHPRRTVVTDHSGTVVHSQEFTGDTPTLFRVTQMVSAATGTELQGRWMREAGAMDPAPVFVATFA